MDLGKGVQSQRWFSRQTNVCLFIYFFFDFEKVLVH